MKINRLLLIFVLLLGSCSNDDDCKNTFSGLYKKCENAQCIYTITLDNGTTIEISENDYLYYKSKYDDDTILNCYEG